MDMDQFKNLALSQQWWLRRARARALWPIKRVAATVFALALAIIVIPMLAHAVQRHVGSDAYARVEIPLDSPTERELLAHLALLDPSDGKLYERYASGARESGMRSAWIRVDHFREWVTAAPSPAATAAAKAQPATLEAFSAWWVEREARLSRSLGRVQTCGEGAGFLATLPWARARDQAGPCQAVAYQTWLAIFLFGCLIAAVAIACLSLVEMILTQAQPALAEDLFLLWRADALSLEDWLEVHGEAQMARREATLIAKAAKRRGLAKTAPAGRRL